MKAIIGGTGIYGLDGECVTRKIETAYGEVLVDLVTQNGVEVCFLARHGRDHAQPPHKVNYRANMAALKALGVTEVLATCAVGSMNKAYGPGDMMLITDFMDFTKNRPMTFYEGDSGVKHVDMSDPYCKVLRKHFKDYCNEYAIDLKGEGIYVCTEGPRFETAAEIRMYKMLGADVVGMTNVPEVVLAKEAGMCYAAVGIVTNWCTGFTGTDITLHEIESVMKHNKTLVTQAFIEILTKRDGVDGQAKEGCNCSNALISL